jgi:large subunit ribosomal protein L29
MAPSEYAAMEPSELEDKLVESRKELFNLRFQKATGQLDNTARIGHVKKDVARILTALRQQELGIEEPGPAPAAGSVARAKSSRRAARREGAAVAGAAVTGADEGGVDEDEEEA